MKKSLEDKWADAAAKPGTKIEVGRDVVCDSCDADYTDDAASGGFIFGSYAICPACADRWEKGAAKHGELGFIRARCPAGTSFGDFVRAYRGPKAFIRISGGGP